MLKISKNEMINEDMVECISVYDSNPLNIIASDARKNGSFREFRGKYGVKTVFIMTDGFVILAPNNTKLYYDRIDKDKFLIADPNRYMINKSVIREISTKPNAQQKRKIKEAKKSGDFVNLSSNKTAKYYIFTTTGRVYSLRLIKEDF